MSLSNFTHTAKFTNEATLVAELSANAGLSEKDRKRIVRNAATLVRRIRREAKPTMMEHFLSEYGLSTSEGVALMCLAEAMLRVPDADTIDALIEDKIAPSDWGKHLGEASSSLVNASTWALMLTGRVLDSEKPGMAGILRGAIKRVGEPVIRKAVGQAMKEMGRQFVLGETIQRALERAKDWEKDGYTYSYDMLGEAAMTAADAARYAISYENAIAGIAEAATHGSVEANPGISIKLSALHPRYEVSQEDRVLTELVPTVLKLAKQAKAANIGLNIDAEEQDRLVLSLKVIEAVLSSPDLAGWDGFGVVVQAYGKRAGSVLDWLYNLATRLDRRIMVRLVKGAYWDTEMKLAQVEGLDDFALFTSKAATDVSYIANARKLLDYADRIYPQFATHNAHTVTAILDMVEDQPFEFQRLHGMGERLHDIVLRDTQGRCRIYAPVGAHRDLLAYLVRRLLENGANSSFVNQLVVETITPEEVARDPFEQVKSTSAPTALSHPAKLFGARQNSKGFDLTDEDTLATIETARSAKLPTGHPLTVREYSGETLPIHNPATLEQVSEVIEADAETVTHAIEDATQWVAPVAERAAALRKAADLYEDNFGLIFATLAQEAGKALPDAVNELREAVDFLRYYADQAKEKDGTARGIFSAISPWNFPLAIFTGQIAAALAAGNAVLAKPAESTPVIATIATSLLHQAGVPLSALQLLPGQGRTVGAPITSDPRISGVVFTGSTATAQTIRKTMAATMDPSAVLIAETGGLNAMIVDSTALPEQAVRDIIASAFQSAGQRCSALRCLYLQDDIAPTFLEMLKGAVDELRVGNPWSLSTDVGPVIHQPALDDINDYISKAAQEGRVMQQLAVPQQGHFVPPTMIKVSGIKDLEREVFGPVLHVATFANQELDKVIADINERGFGLTFGLHTRIDSRVEDIAQGIHAGNIYVNRNQIGAIVGSQPFGGEGLSGTGPKAGGPNYLTRFYKPAGAPVHTNWGQPCNPQDLQNRLNHFKTGEMRQQIDLPGPTGEANILRHYSRGPILCLGPGAEAVKAQKTAVENLGGQAVSVDGYLEPSELSRLDGFDGVLWWGENAREFALALSERDGPILPLITSMPDLGHVVHERHLCIDTTAAGGNASLLAS
jgi:RHH-type proline utilization regulon transcriptional repressor/proline dehydrogenase/delta 1-pyrroline-5-carboxylate dehydrogenase